jgi:hypothetical protein
MTTTEQAKLKQLRAERAQARREYGEAWVRFMACRARLTATCRRQEAR